MTETECGDDKDNDGDGLTDCGDSDCCSNPSCAGHLMCLASADPAEIAARKPLLSAGSSSFYQRVKFLVEDNAVQSYAHKDEYVDRYIFSSQINPCWNAKLVLLKTGELPFYVVAFCRNKDSALSAFVSASIVTHDSVSLSLAKADGLTSSSTAVAP